MGGTWYEKSVPAHLYSKLAWDIAFQPPSGQTILSAIFDNLIIHVSCKNNTNYTSFCCSCIDIDGGEFESNMPMLYTIDYNWPKHSFKIKIHFWQQGNAVLQYPRRDTTPPMENTDVLINRAKIIAKN